MANEPSEADKWAYGCMGAGCLIVIFTWLFAHPKIAAALVVVLAIFWFIGDCEAKQEQHLSSIHTYFAMSG